MQLPFRYPLLALVLGALIVPAVTVSAQGKVTDKSLPVLPPPPLSKTGGTRAEPFVLGPGDVISLKVANLPELSSDALTLSSTGRVVLPILGPLTIKDKTLEQARRAIATAYKAQVRDPKVSIALVSARPRQVTILGVVMRPSVVDLQPGWRISEVLAAAGGLNKLAPDEVNATMKRLSGLSIPLDIAMIYRAPENKANPRVAVGDVINVMPIAQINVTINGDVGTPGPQISRKSPKLLDALGRAGSLKFSPENSQVTLLREGKIIPLDAAAASDAPASAANIELRDGDLLSVQGIRLNVNVISDENLVKSPGNYQLDGRSSFMRAIAEAGGLVGGAGKISASVRRNGTVIPVDLERAVYDPDADIALQNNDIILLKPIDGPRVRLTGEVKSPDQYNFKGGVKALEAVLQAGGLNVATESARISVLRTLPDGRQITLQVDAERLLSGNDASQNVTLQDGDVVLVNSILVQAVSILGEVEKPGIYELKAGDGLAEALTNAGGPSKLADLKRIIILNKANVARVVDASNAGKDEVTNIQLEDGERVQVPINPNQFLVLDGVLKPGRYALPDDEPLTLNDALNNAGGPIANARTNEITLIRRVPVTTENPLGYTTTLVKYEVNVDETKDLALQAGDVVLVPRGKNSASKLQNAITALNAFNPLRGF